MSTIDEIAENLNEVSKDILYEGINMKIHATDYCEHASFLLDEISRLTAKLDSAEKRIEELTAAAKAGDAWREKALSLQKQNQHNLNCYMGLYDEYKKLKAEHCPGCLPDGLCRRMPEGTAEQLRADRDHRKARAEALEAWKDRLRDIAIGGIESSGDCDNPEIREAMVWHFKALLHLCEEAEAALEGRCGHE